jgi:hypothetical protein
MAKIKRPKKEVIIKGKSRQVAIYKPSHKTTRLVTDIQYYMDGYLSDNLNEIPKFLRGGWDCVIIISGHSKVRIGKSTLATQVGYYLAWLLAGGEKKEKEKEVPFSNENFAFSPQQLMKKAETFPPHSVIIYDEAMTGLNSARAMENINKSMLDFFIQCGNLRQIIIIVLPNYFRLNEDIAVPRSLFLLDCYTDEKYHRGQFAFYNEGRKELLYSFGKKKYGTFQKYNATYPNFRGKFTDFMPNIDVELYEKQKKQARAKQKLSEYQKRIAKQRNALMWVLNREQGMSERVIAEKITVISGVKMSRRGVSGAINTISEGE